MDVMAEFADGHFDLAIVDPPYGIGEDGGKCRTRGSKRTNGEAKGWDKEPPPMEYFVELRRVAKHQIIWGGNYFADKLPASRCWIYWQKDMGGDFADGELAWTSFDRVLKQFRKRSETHGRIHPTQKPVDLYKWTLANFAKPGMRVLDTHLGSGSHAIAAHYAGIHLTACEIDADYFHAAKARIERETSQMDFLIPHNVEVDRGEVKAGIQQCGLSPSISPSCSFSSSWDRWEPFNDWVASLVFKQAITGIAIGWGIAVMIAVILSWLMPTRSPRPKVSPVSPPTSQIESSAILLPTTSDSTHE